MKQTGTLLCWEIRFFGNKVFNGSFDGINKITHKNVNRADV